MADAAVLPAVRAPFRAIATTVVPEASALDDAAWAQLERIVEEALSQRPPGVRRQLATFIRLVDLLPLPRYGRRFSALDERRRERVLHALENAPLLLLRRGFWGVRTLVFMGYYAQPSIGAALGYRATVRGWEARA